jgi:hypothetical protein
VQRATSHLLARPDTSLARQPVAVATAVAVPIKIPTAQTSTSGRQYGA